MGQTGDRQNGRLTGVGGGGTPVGRRTFLRTLAGTTLALAGTAASAAAAVLPRSLRSDHPDPRPGIDGSNVIKADELSDPELVPLFEGIAKIPQIADGIRCSCGCASDPAIRSLLSCYEKASGMAKFCPICQSEGRMVIRLNDAGRTLDQIREALDAKFG